MRRVVGWVILAILLNVVVPSSARAHESVGRLIVSPDSACLMRAGEWPHILNQYLYKDKLSGWDVDRLVLLCECIRESLRNLTELIPRSYYIRYIEAVPSRGHSYIGGWYILSKPSLNKRLINNRRCIAEITHIIVDESRASIRVHNIKNDNIWPLRYVKVSLCQSSRFLSRTSRIASGTRRPSSFLERDPQKAHRNERDHELDSSNPNQSVGRSSHGLLSHQVRFFAALGALLLSGGSGFVAATYLYPLIEYGPKRRDVRNYYGLALWAAICLLFFGLWMWLSYERFWR